TLAKRLVENAQVAQQNVKVVLIDVTEQVASYMNDERYKNARKYIKPDDMVKKVYDHDGLLEELQALQAAGQPQESLEDACVEVFEFI
ncbi:hypothetical protein ACXWOR_10195, partial [Streptococcus pyogenes]